MYICVRRVHIYRDYAYVSIYAVVWQFICARLVRIYRCLATSCTHALYNTWHHMCTHLQIVTAYVYVLYTSTHHMYTSCIHVQIVASYVYVLYTSTDRDSICVRLVHIHTSYVCVLYTSTDRHVLHTKSPRNSACQSHDIKQMLNAEFCADFVYNTWQSSDVYNAYECSHNVSSKFSIPISRYQIHEGFSSWNR